MGAPQEVIAKLEAEHASASTFEVWPEHMESVELFVRLQTQWVMGGMGGFIGLNYQSVEFLVKMFQVKDPKQTLEDLQVMELAALKILNKEATK